MLIHLYQQATTTPKAWAALQASTEPASALAARFGTTEQTVYKWKHRDNVQDFHSDRGSQYCSHDYQKVLREHGLKASMSGKGNCYDNAAVETFFKTIKAELIWRRTWETRRQAETAFGHSFGPMAGMPSLQYINGFYNPRRRHSASGGKNPLAFERQVA